MNVLGSIHNMWIHHYLEEVESVRGLVEPGVSLLRLHHLRTHHLTPPTHHLPLHLLLCDGGELGPITS